MTDIFAEVNTHANKLHKWFLADKLTLNTSKTTDMIFSKSQKLKSEGLNIIIGNTYIQRNPSTKSLGFHKDMNLDWHEQIDHEKTKSAEYFLL